MRNASFDRVARVYRPLEYIAFGRDLERARFQFLGHLRDCRNILILGEGDGRCLARLLELAPRARFDCIDASAGMIAAAAARIPAELRRRVTFTCADARTAELKRAPYDGVITLFFLDCLTTADVAALISRVQRALLPGARWLFADFVLPERGWPRIRAKVWLRLLYTFFRWETGLRVDVLPESESVLAHAGFAAEASRTFQHGLLRTTVYRLASSGHADRGSPS